LKIKSGTSSTFGVRLKEAWDKTPLPMHVEARLQVLEVLNQQIAAVTKEIRKEAKTNKVCQLLQTVPGVGPLVSTAFQSQLGTPRRFQAAAAVTSYLGLTPGENSSGERERKTHITKAGSSELRMLLVLAAHVALQRRKTEPMTQWAMRVAEKRGKQKAVVALARKMAGVLWAVWKSDQPYDAARAAAKVEPLVK
jgi:transposase